MLGKLPFQSFKDDVREKSVVDLIVKNKRDAKLLRLIFETQRHMGSSLQSGEGGYSGPDLKPVSDGRLHCPIAC